MVVYISDADDRRPAESRDSGERRSSLSEVYGFIGSITTVVATAIFIIWAYVPDYWLHSVGIHYYPSRYWAVAVPTYVVVTIVLAIWVYIGLNFLATPPPTSLKLMFDEYSEESLYGILSTNEDEQVIEPISDISTTQVDEMFNNSN